MKRAASLPSRKTRRASRGLIERTLLKAARAGGYKVTLHQGLDDRVATLIQVSQAKQAFPDGGNGDLVERACGFLAVAGDKGNGGSFSKELGRGGNLPRLDVQFASDFVDVSFVREKGISCLSGHVRL